MIQRVRSLAGILACLGVVAGAGCTVPVPPATASPQEVMTAFLKASKAGDTRTGRELSGDCWPAVEGWFSTKRDAFTKFSVDPTDAPAPYRTETRVDFSSRVGGSSSQGDWRAQLRRNGPAERWRVCEVKLRGGG